MRRATADVLMRACRALAERGEAITTHGVWLHLEGRVPKPALSLRLSGLEERGFVKRVRRTRFGKGNAYTYELVEASR